MSEPIKKSNQQQPESYNPKKPETMNMLEKLSSEQPAKFIENIKTEVVIIEEDIKVVGVSKEKLKQQGIKGKHYSEMEDIFLKNYSRNVKNNIDPDVRYWFWYMERNPDSGFHDYITGNAVTEFEDVDKNLAAYVILAGRYIKDSFNAESHKALLDGGATGDGVLGDRKQVVKNWAKENGYKIIDSGVGCVSGIEVYSEKEFTAKYPAMHTLTPIE